MVNARYASHTLLMLGLCVGAQAMHEVSRRMLEVELEARHSFAPEEKRADPAFPKFGATKLMTTTCHPEADGYFGGTAGEPVTLKYGFLMETAIHGDIHAALQAIDEFVMDSILSNIFPEVCGDQRRLSSIYEKGRATGFKFDSETIDMERACQPTSNNMNYCAVYSGTIMMYGRDLEVYGTADTVLGYAMEAIYNSLAAASEYGVVNLIVDENLTKAVSLKVVYGSGYAGGASVDFAWGQGGNEDNQERDHFSPGAKAGLTISTLALIASLVGFFLYFRLEEKAGNITKRTRAERFIQKSDGTSFFARLLAYGGRAGTDSNASSDEVEPSLQIQIEDGKPVFAPCISDSAVHFATESSGSNDSIEHSGLVDAHYDVDSFLNEPNDVDSLVGSLADESVILPDDDPGDNMYLEAFR